MDRHGPLHLGEGQVVALIGDDLGGTRWRTLMMRRRHNGVVAFHPSQLVSNPGRYVRSREVDSGTAMGAKRSFGGSGVTLALDPGCVKTPLVILFPLDLRGIG